MAARAWVRVGRGPLGLRTPSVVSEAQQTSLLPVVASELQEERPGGSWAKDNCAHCGMVIPRSRDPCTRHVQRMKVQRSSVRSP